jgi:hypothetical protein
MKRIVVALLAAGLSTQAALVQFEISPSGTDFGVGLSPSNVVPAVTNSSGSGGAISGGIMFDSDTSLLEIALGYGSAAGFTNLTGVATGMHLNGPASTNQSAGVLLDLSPFNFPAAAATNGGVIFGTVAFPTNAVSNLLAGLTYVQIETALNANGEIRGQLVPVVATNSPPSVSCPPASTVPCAVPSTFTAMVSDPDGDALTVVWSVNGAFMQTNTLPATPTPAPVNVSLTATLPLGTNTLAIMVTDTATNTASCSSTITVVDTNPPVITDVTATPNVLWPPNHKFVEITVHATVTDTCDTATWKIISVSSNEVAKGKGSKSSSAWKITGAHTVKLLAERDGKGSGRIYTITVQAEDVSGNLSAPATVTVTVPHDKGKN